MVRKIDRDHSRFREIVRGRIKQDLKKFVSSGELIGRQGGKYVSIPIPQVNLPKFRFGKNPKGEVGQGEGGEGEGIEKGDGSGAAGEDSGQHILEVDVTLEELAEILGEELELPNIEPKGKKVISQAVSARRACDTSSARTRKRSSVRSLRGSTIPTTPRSSPCAPTSVTSRVRILCSRRLTP